MVVHKQEIITNLMEQYPVTKLQPNSKDHARHALEQGLVDMQINLSVYEELIGYIIFVMYEGNDAEETANT